MMSEDIDSIHQILPNTRAGTCVVREPDPGGKAQAIRRWIRSILRKIILYQDEHQRLLNEAAMVQVVVLPNNDIVMRKSFHFSSCHHTSLKWGMMNKTIVMEIMVS